MTMQTTLSLQNGIVSYLYLVLAIPFPLIDEFPGFHDGVRTSVGCGWNSWSRLHVRKSCIFVAIVPLPMLDQIQQSAAVQYPAFVAESPWSRIPEA